MASHNRRRAYPSAQYNLNPAESVQPGYGSGAPQVGTPSAQIYGGVSGVPGVDPLTQGFASMNLNQQPAQQVAPVVDPSVNAGLNGVAQAYGNPAYPPLNSQPAYYGQSAQPSQQPLGSYGSTPSQLPALPMNQLYSTDLLKELPPPISDLQLPPPPVILAPGISLTGQQDSNSPPEYFRSTLNVLPTTNNLLKKTKLPLALVVRPYISLHNSEVPVAVVSDALISRCRRCRTYINPFVTFQEDGKRWRCNLCNLLNDTPMGFDFNQATSTPVNRLERSELNHAVVEFVAPPEYMVRAPQPLVFVFVLDVSAAALANGALATVSRTILDSLDRIPNKDGRARVSFIGVSSSLTFFQIPADEEADKETSLLVVSDLDDVLIPAAEGLLVNLADCRSNVEKLLANFNDYFAGSGDQGSAFGPALKSAHRLINSLGGKIVCFTSSLPNIGIGKLTVRDEESVADKPKEASALLGANNAFYKSFAVDCNKSQVTVDMFLTGSSYQDVATLANLPRYSAGQTHFYPAWSASRMEDITKLSKEISNHLSMEIQLEAVMRIRGSTGTRMSAFYGNFFNRSSDLCSFPTFARDQSYVIEMAIEETLTKPYAYVQAAVLHTTAFGERRIRVLTLALPTSKEIKDIYASADQLAIANYYTHKAIEKTYSSSLNDAREYLNKSMIEILQTYKKELVAGNIGSSSPVQICTNLRMLPLLLHSLTKNIGFRSGKVPSDHRANALNLLGSMPLPYLIKYIYPSVYSLHDMPDDCGLPFTGEEDVPEEGLKVGETVLPTPLNATITNFEKYGLYLVCNTSELFLWVGGDAVPQLVNDLFGFEDISEIPIGKVDLPELDSDFNVRVRNIIGKIREHYDTIVYQNLYIIRGPSSNENAYAATANREVIPLRMWCMSGLVEDRSNGSNSYREYLGQLREKVVS
ncbi:unnamed protein product [Kuraishia capsulata CBS 1993]|uniref:Protein transport protein SEC24 n=1 Tax=Kuraishia capsulata CBS 1993 TaxID=1382522 RepID=W6MQ45_9ASCO|nr:uncharacterized protein KUCA_T00003350001 [Kuraishia capsulata CBS 1993]CDK27372.1 unnamed protein product [Kuraishia capsulata CBS 1993]